MLHVKYNTLFKKCPYCERDIRYHDFQNHKQKCPLNPENEGSFQGQCKFCGQKGYVTVSSLHYHENRCYENPDRIKWTFEGKKHKVESKKKQAYRKVKEIDFDRLSSRTITKVLDRMEAKCQRCGWNEASLDLHHIVTRRQGGSDSPDNLAPLCPNCHRLVHCQKYTGPLRSFSEIYGDTWKEFYYGFTQPEDTLTDKKISRSKLEVHQRKIEQDKKRYEIAETRKKLVQESNIDFSKVGWNTKLASLLKLSDNGARKFLKTYMSETYNQAWRSCRRLD